MFVRDRSSSPVVTTSPSVTYRAALEIMRANSCRRLPVVADDGSLIGIVTERDVLRTALRFQEAPVEVSEIMTAEVRTVRADAPVEEAAKIMMTYRIGGLPVLDERDRLIGVITETDIFNAFIDIIEALETHPSHPLHRVHRPSEAT